MSNDEYQQQQFWSDSDELKLLQGKILIYHQKHLSKWYEETPEGLLKIYEDLFNMRTHNTGRI